MVCDGKNIFCFIFYDLGYSNEFDFSTNNNKKNIMS